MVRLRLIGQMEAWTITSESILPTGRKTRALLSIVALSAPRPVLRGKLAEMLWSRRPEEQARASLRQEIHRLLEALDPIGNQTLAVSRDHLMLRPGAVWIDVEEVLRATPAKPAALALLDGELLEDLDGVDPAFDGWLVGERERLRDRARVLAETMLREQTDPEGLIEAAQRLLTIDRSHEGAWRALMRTYAARGERGMAIQAYDRCRAVLAEQLDAPPSEETQRLLAEIRLTSQPRTGGPTNGAHPPLTATRGAPDARSPMRPEQRGDTRPEPRGDTRSEPRTELRIDIRATSRGGVRVGVLPLQLVNATESDANLSTGIADEVTAALSRFRWMYLVSSGSLARFAQQTRDETAIRRGIGLDFLVDGTIQRVSDRLRISMRLLDLRAGAQVAWSRRFDYAASDPLGLQDEIAGEAAAQIEPEIMLLEAHRVGARPPADPTAYDQMLRALTLAARLERQSFMQAGDLLRRATEQDQDNAPAFAWYAYWYVFLVGQAWTRDPKAAMAEAGRLAERAVQVDPQDAKALTIAGHVRASLHHRLRESLTLHERAVTLNPNLPMAWSLSSLAHAYVGDIEEAERRSLRYRKLAPPGPPMFVIDTSAIFVPLLKHDFEAAGTAGRAATEMNPGFVPAYKPYLAALGHLRQTAEADRIRLRLLAIEPGFTLRRFNDASPFARPQDREVLANGLKLAGIEE